MHVHHNPHTAPLLEGSEVSHRIRSKYNGIFIDENTNENTIFFDENTNNTYEIASFPIFSTLTLMICTIINDTFIGSLYYPISKL